MLLEQLLLDFPCPIFWKAANGVFLGCNKSFLTSFEIKSFDDLIGKNDACFSWKKNKERYHQEDQKIITTGVTLKTIEDIPLNSRVMISETTKIPVIKDGSIDRVLGVCIDISKNNNIENLKLENQINNIFLKQQNQFKKILTQTELNITSLLDKIAVTTIKG